MPLSALDLLFLLVALASLYAVVVVLRREKKSQAKYDPDQTLSFPSKQEKLDYLAVYGLGRSSLSLFTGMQFQAFLLAKDLSEFVIEIEVRSATVADDDEAGALLLNLTEKYQRELFPKIDALYVAFQKEGYSQPTLERSLSAYGLPQIPLLRNALVALAHLPDGVALKPILGHDE